MAAPIDASPFHVAVGRLFKSWTALQLSVQHSFGGHDSQEKANWMVDAVEQWFKENDNIQPYEVEDFLAEVMDTEFNTITDDGSLDQIAQSICKYYHLCQDNKLVELEQLISKLPKADISRCQGEPEADENDTDDEKMEIQPGSSHSSNTATQNNTQEPVEDMEQTEDDGWTVVHKKAHRK